MFRARRTSSAVFVDISGFTVIKIVLASIDALVEKEVIPEVSEELSCTRALVTLQAPFFVSSGVPGHPAPVQQPACCKITLVKPFELLDQTLSPDGTALKLV